MADEQTIEYLNKWNLTNLVETFKSHKITFSRFEILRKELIQEFIPEIEDRLDFMENFEQEFGGRSSNNSIDIDIASATDESNDENLMLNNKRKRAYDSNEGEYRKNLKKNNNTKYVRGLLDSANFGSAIKSEYNKNNYLSDATSLMLCDIIVSDLIVGCESKVSNSDLSDIADEIIEIFPTEVKCLLRAFSL